MKKALAVFLAAVLLFSGCGLMPVSGTAQDYEKLWSMDIGQEGYSRTDASHDVVRQGEDIQLTFAAMPTEFKPRQDPDRKSVRAGGREFHVVDRAIEPDGIDEDGHIIMYDTVYTRDMVWEQGGYIFY